MATALEQGSIGDEVLRKEDRKFLLGKGRYPWITTGVALLDLDITGYLRGTEFLSLLANAVSAAILSLLNLIVAGALGMDM